MSSGDPENRFGGMTGSSTERSVDDPWFHFALARLFSISQSVAASAGFTEMTSRIAEGLLGLGGSESVSIYLFDHDGKHVHLLSCANAPNWTRDSDDSERRSLSDWPSLEEVVFSNSGASWLVAEASI